MKARRRAGRRVAMAALVLAGVACLGAASCARVSAAPRAAGQRAPDPEWDYYAALGADILSLPAAASGRVTVAACGDVLLTRTMALRMSRGGYRAPFAYVAEAVKAADLAFVNLETPASFVGSPYPGKPENVTFRASPGALFGLKWAGFDVVSLANNHMNDYGPVALAETIEYLDMLGVGHCGAGANDREARKPAVLERNGLRLAFLAYAEPVWSVTRAGGASPGVAHAILQDIVADVKSVKASLRPHHVFVSIHWGDELARIPRSFQTELGRAAVDAGASVVLGHHPHVLQSVERYKDGLIVYSLGNFVFDMIPEATYETAIFRIELEGRRITRLVIEPVKIGREDNAPRLAAPSEADAILKGLAAWSARFGTKIGISGGTGIVEFR